MEGVFVFSCLVLAHLVIASGLTLLPVSYDCSNQQGCQNVKGQQCCLSKFRPRGKRSLSKQQSGYCAAFGTSGQSCLVEQGTQTAPYYICPCAPGYTCVASGFRDFPLGDLGTCQLQCTDNSECLKGQCCRIGEVLKGRKKRSAYNGVCTSFGTLGSKCVNGTDPLTYNNVHTECPCASPLDCNVSDGYRTIPVDFATCG
ncbi:hypothetical protein SNE40_001856 [Patella caerulea]|uniref:Uncharacterized protein n=1 Tax=Patella caerulea TaxID=87958 RepID=A0AAN8K6N0_PATCE